MKRFCQDNECKMSAKLQSFVYERKRKKSDSIAKTSLQTENWRKQSDNKNANKTIDYTTIEDRLT